MHTGSPPISRVITMVLFALSCVGLLLFLWLSFGGTIPLGAQGYRVNVSFPNAQDLATQADVRISGVTVGKVVSTQLNPKGNLTEATLQLQTQYTPIRQDTKAILRTKTILGETYVQLIPGSPNAPPIRDGGSIPQGQVQSEVQLSDIFNAFDPTTRHAFQVWQQQLSTAVSGNDQNLNDVLGNLPSFAADASDVLQVLDVQHQAVVSLLQNGGTVFGALGANQTALQNLITSGEKTFATTAANNNQLAKTFEVFPTFLNETKTTMQKLQAFSVNTDPLIKELDPVAQQLKPTLQSVQQLSPPLRHLFTNLGPLITVSQTGLPAVHNILTGLEPTLGSLGTFLEQLNPILGWLSDHQQLISDFISNGASPIAATTTSFSGGVGHYLRQFSPTGSETLSLAPNRDSNNRGNTYPGPVWLANPQIFTKGNFPAWDCKNTGAGGNGSVGASGSAGTPGSQEACWVAPALPGASQGQIPHLLQASYPSK
ncbi:MAG TPA: MlaD family protein [Solirubrobacteraceae bacterium]|jgi:virulence factor Mce-like protein|nr:MlaD family protein [Solirubrobacteraceae bacterium]